MNVIDGSRGAGVVSGIEKDGPVMRIGDIRVGPSGDVKSLEELNEQLMKVDEQPVNRLSSHLVRLWERSKRHREQSGVEDELMECLLASEGEYSAKQLSTLAEQDEPVVFEPLTGDICSNAVSWIEDLLNLPEGNIFSIDATPLPDMPEEVVQMVAAKVMQKAAQHMQATGVAPAPDEVFEMAKALRAEIEAMVKADAEARAEAMSQLIKDQFLEGGFWEAFLTCVNDLTIFPTAWLKGPVVYRDEELEWTVGKDGPLPKVGEVLKPQWVAPSPFDMFPSPQSKRVNEGYLFERMRFEPAALEAFKGVPGFNDEAIEQVLKRYSAGGHADFTQYDQVRARLEKRYGELMCFEGVIEVCEFTGKLRGKDLQDWGFSSKLDENRFYPVIAWLCNGECIMARMNVNPRGDWNVSAGSYRPRPGSIWGKGVPQVVKEDQKKANGYARASAMNAAQSAGPQTMVDITQLADGQDVSTSFPGKIWQLKGASPGATNAGRQAVQHFQPAAVFMQLEQQIERVKKQADQRAGIPPFAYGSDNNRGAADTVGGLSILMNNAAKGLRSILRHLDADILRPTVARAWFFNMIYHPDNSVKGDVQVKARGALGQVVKETMFLRRQDFLTATANPVDAQIIGLEGRRRQLEELEVSLDYPKNSIVPTKEELEERLTQAEGGSPMTDNGGPMTAQPQPVVEAGAIGAQSGVDNV